MAFWKKFKSSKGDKKNKKQKPENTNITKNELKELILEYTVSDIDNATITELSEGPVTFIEDTEVISEEGVKKHRTEIIKELFRKLIKNAEKGSNSEKLIKELASDYPTDSKAFKESFRKTKLSEAEKEVEVLLWLTLKYVEKELITFDNAIQVYNKLRSKTTTESKIPALLYRIYKTFEAMAVDNFLFISALRKGLLLSYESSPTENERAVIIIDTLLGILNTEYEFEVDTWNTLRLIISGKLQVSDLLYESTESVEEEIVSSILEEEDLEYEHTELDSESLNVSSDFELILKMSESMRVITNSSEFEMLLIKLVEAHEKISGNIRLKIHLANGSGECVILDKNNIKDGLDRIITAQYCNHKFSNAVSCLQVQTERDPNIIYLIIYDYIIDKLRSGKMIDELLKSNDNLVFRFIQMNDNEDFEGLCNNSQYLNTELNGIIDIETLNDSLKFAALLSKLLE